MILESFIEHSADYPIKSSVILSNKYLHNSFDKTFDVKVFGITNYFPKLIDKEGSFFEIKISKTAISIKLHSKKFYLESSSSWHLQIPLENYLVKFEHVVQLLLISLGLNVLQVKQVL